MKPKYAPTKTSGVEIPNHSTARANSVPNGTAPEDFSPQMIMLRMKKMKNDTPGYKSAVIAVFCLHASPFILW